jgi:hypothetical protein
MSSSDPPQVVDDASIVRILIDELLRSKEAGDDRAVERINRELRDIMGRRVLPRSTIRPVPK